MAARIISYQVWALVCLAAVVPPSGTSPVAPRVVQSSTNVALVPRDALPANFTVLSVALLPDPVANVTLLPLSSPTLAAVPPNAASLVNQLPLVPPLPPELPESAVPGEAYVLSHVIIEVGVLEDDNSMDNGTSDYDDSLTVPEAEPVQEKKLEDLKSEPKESADKQKASNDGDEKDVKKQDAKEGAKNGGETDQGDIDKKEKTAQSGEGEDKVEKTTNPSKGESTAGDSGNQ